MKTTLDLNDALLTQAKTLAAQLVPAKPVRLPVYRGQGGLAVGLTGLSNKAMLDAADEDA